MKNVKLYLEFSIFCPNGTFVLVVINSKLVLDWVGRPRLENLQFYFQIKCDQVMFLHLSVSHSVHRRGICPGECVSQHTLDRHPLPGQMPPAGTPPLAETPRAGTLQADTPWQTHPPGRHTLLLVATTADGMHPTGMHSCYNC